MKGVCIYLSASFLAQLRGDNNKFFSNNVFNVCKCLKIFKQHLRISISILDNKSCGASQIVGSFRCLSFEGRQHHTDHLISFFRQDGHTGSFDSFFIIGVMIGTNARAYRGHLRTAIEDAIVRGLDLLLAATTLENKIT